MPPRTASSRWASGLGLALSAALAAAPVGCARQGDEPALVFAAASLADVLTEAAGRIPRDAQIDLNFAGSSVLTEQVLAGAPADLFVSADRRQVERLVAAGKVRREGIVPLAGNRLVVVVPAEGGTAARAAGDDAAVAAPVELLDFRRLALADPEAAPAGVYAREWLEREGLWDDLASRVVPTVDARAALAAVASGHLPAGIVYATDARSTVRVQVVYRVPPERAPLVEYLAAPIAGRGGGGAAAAELLAFLRGPEGRALLARHGFEPPHPGAVAGRAPESPGTGRGGDAGASAGGDRAQTGPAPPDGG